CRRGPRDAAPTAGAVTAGTATASRLDRRHCVGMWLLTTTRSGQAPTPKPTLRTSEGAISTYAMRSEGTRNLRPLSSVSRNRPSSVSNASETCFSTSSEESALEITSSLGASLMPILTSTCDLRVVLIVVIRTHDLVPAYRADTPAHPESPHPRAVPLL